MTTPSALNTALAEEVLQCNGGIPKCYCGVGLVVHSFACPAEYRPAVALALQSKDDSAALEIDRLKGEIERLDELRIREVSAAQSKAQEIYIGLQASNRTFEERLATLQREGKCTACDGSGYYDDEGAPSCEACGGSGLNVGGLICRHERQVAEMQAAYERQFTEWQKIFALVIDRDAEIKALKGEIARLRAALEPFGKPAYRFGRVLRKNGGELPDDNDLADDPPSGIYIGDLRKARAALQTDGGKL